MKYRNWYIIQEESFNTKLLLPGQMSGRQNAIRTQIFTKPYHFSASNNSFYDYFICLVI